MKKVLLILVVVLLLAVVEQTTGQKCSLEFCRRRPSSDCRCRGCCWGKLNCRFGSCRRHTDPITGRRITSCFCSRCGGRVGKQSGEDGPD